MSENLVKFCLNYFKDKHNIETFKIQFSNENSSAMEEDIKQYISEDEDISCMILYILNIRVKMAFMLSFPLEDVCWHGIPGENQIGLDPLNPTERILCGEIISI